MSDIGKHILKYRKARGLSQDDLAERLYVARQTVSSWETGRTMPDIAMLTRIAEAVGVGIEQLIYGKAAETAPRDVSRYRKAALVTAALLVLAVTAMLLIKPYIGYSFERYDLLSILQINPKIVHTAQTFHLWAELLYMSLLRPLGYMLGAACFLSLISLRADLTIRRSGVRCCLLCVSAALLLLFAYFVMVVYSVLPGGRWAHIAWLLTAFNPYIFVLPGAGLFFGLNRREVAK
jgi:transcriptional regulator with XRE-family HTH domain